MTNDVFVPHSKSTGTGIGDVCPLSPGRHNPGIINARAYALSQLLEVDSR